MAMKCRCCTSLQRAAIDKACVRGLSAAEIAAKFGTSSDSVQRHRDRHIGKVLARAEVQEVARGVDLIEEIRILRRRMDGIVAKAMRAGNLGVAVQGMRELREQLSLLGRFLAVANAETAVTDGDRIPLGAFRALQAREDQLRTVDAARRRGGFAGRGVDCG